MCANDNETPLFVAAEYGKRGAVKLLLRKGAEKDKKKTKPTGLAIRKKLRSFPVYLSLYQ